MAAPHIKNAPKNIVLVWDETAKDYKVWDGAVSGGAGYDTVWLKDILGSKINPATAEGQLPDGHAVKVKDSAGVVQDWTKPEGQEASANSIGVVLSTEQESLLNDIKTNTASATGYEVVGLKNAADDRINPATETTLLNLLTSSVFNGVLGEVQTTPTAFTVLDRLKNIKTSIDTNNIIGLKDSSQNIINPAKEDGGNLEKIPGLSIPIHDYISLSYTGDNLTGVVYKTGGSTGTTVATLTLAYTGARLDSVTKT